MRAKISHHSNIFSDSIPLFEAILKCKNFNRNVDIPLLEQIAKLDSPGAKHGAFICYKEILESENLNKSTHLLLQLVEKAPGPVEDGVKYFRDILNSRNFGQAIEKIFGMLINHKDTDERHSTFWVVGEILNRAPQRSIAKTLGGIFREKEIRLQSVLLHAFNRSLDLDIDAAKFLTLIPLMKSYWTKVGPSRYAAKLLEECTWDKDGRVRLKPLDSPGHRLPCFVKSGNELMPFGGRLTGFIHKVVTSKNFEAWKRTFDAGVPCEDIIRFSERQDGLVSVVTKYRGDNLENFRKEHPELADAVNQQAWDIRDWLPKIGVKHGHNGDQNFVVEMEAGAPVVRIIDFDKAEVLAHCHSYLATYGSTVSDKLGANGGG
ncbi:MAG: hypothetical protein NTX79_04580 [Candidatus Micrarchaeota archaeon]|nr:hypothetical protein [Candidatus Micrarchaeota archaeon]